MASNMNSIIINDYVENTKNNIRRKYSQGGWRQKDILLDTICLDNGLSPHECSILLRTLSMHAGMMWQKMAGGMPGITDLGKAHRSGLDLETLNDVMELKNSTSTDNSDSKKEKYRKLAAYSIETKKRPVYAIINDHKNPDGRVFENTYKHGDQLITIHVYTGKKLLNYIFGNELENVIRLITEKLNEIKVVMCEAFQKNKIE